MKKVFMTMALIVAIATSAAAMTNGQIRNHARSMTNKMVADLHLTRHQAARVYSINLEYLNTMDKPNANVRHLVNLRNHEMSRVLSAHQYRRYIASSDSHWYPAGWDIVGVMPHPSITTIRATITTTDINRLFRSAGV